MMNVLVDIDCRYDSYLVKNTVVSHLVRALFLDMFTKSVLFVSKNDVSFSCVF